VSATSSAASRGSDGFELMAGQEKRPLLVFSDAFSMIRIITQGIGVDQAG